MRWTWTEHWSYIWKWCVYLVHECNVCVHMPVRLNEQFFYYFTTGGGWGSVFTHVYFQVWRLQAGWGGPHRINVLLSGLQFRTNQNLTSRVLFLTFVQVQTVSWRKSMNSFDSVFLDTVEIEWSCRVLSPIRWTFHSPLALQFLWNETAGQAICRKGYNLIQSYIL